MQHAVIRAAVDLNLPIQIHTGMQTGSGNVIANSRPSLLTNLFMRYQKARFDIFHAGYPYHSELAVLTKNFPNVYANLCWLPIISPWMAERVLSEWLEVIPISKIFAFGGDYTIVEGALGACYHYPPGCGECFARKDHTRIFFRESSPGLRSQNSLAKRARILCYWQEIVRTMKAVMCSEGSVLLLSRWRLCRRGIPWYLPALVQQVSVIY